MVKAIVASLEAGKEILDIYESTIEVEYKEDNSPLTIADKKSHDVIVKALLETGIPILSEEGKELTFDERSSWSTLWIVDPLDGTKEFIKKNGEFTVNVGLVENGAPIMGVIYVPVEETLYFAAEGFGAFRINKAAHFTGANNIEDYMNKAVKLPEKQDRPFTMVGSRSHMSTETADYFQGIREKYPEAEVISRGSSLKICMIAEGSADVYPRFAPTMEWDTCAGHAIALEAGFVVVRPDTETPLLYNKENLLNPWFIVKPVEG